MKIKDKAGVTLTILVITIVIMLILFEVTYSTSTNLLKNTRRNKMKTMLYMVKSRAEILLDDYLFDYDNEDQSKRTDNLRRVTSADIQSKLGGIRVTDVRKLQSLGFENYDSDLSKEIYCEWDKEALLKQGIDEKNLAKDDTIIVKYDLVNETVEVASTKGHSDSDGEIHKLSDFKD